MMDRLSFSISKVPGTYEGKLAMLEHFLLLAEESFDNEDRTFNYALTEKEYQVFELIQTLGSDFAKELTELIALAHPAIGLSRNIKEAERMVDNDR